MIGSMKKRTVDTRSSALNMDWTLALDMSGDWPNEMILCALLADIRAELRNLNSLLHCRNFTDIPHKLDRIKRNTTKVKRVKKAAK